METALATNQAYGGSNPFSRTTLEKNMISVKEQLPKVNSMCNIRTTDPELKIKGGPYQFVTFSYGGYFWDNLKTEILQDYEVSHWEYAK
jgi:hypothetical protein